MATTQRPRRATPARHAGASRGAGARRPPVRLRRRIPEPGPGAKILIFFGVMGAASLLFALALLPSVGAAGRVASRMASHLSVFEAGGRIEFPAEPLRSTVYAADGSVLATLFGAENRKYVPLSQVNDITRKAVLATEDAKFYEHRGIDIVGIVRAAAANFASGDVAQGASTITQQLARNAFPEIGTERTIQRKIHEAQVAIQIERAYEENCGTADPKRCTKDKILELYLNRVYFGGSVYGMGTAAEYYFSKDVADLTLPEGALLAGLIAAPERFSPENDMAAATERRSHVLRRMVDTRAITDEEAAAAEATPITLQIKPPKKPRYPFFVTYMRNRILEDPAFGTTREARANTLFQGGLKITTTLDPKLQKAGEAAAKRYLPLKEDPETATAAVDPRTGAIKALVSSQKFEKSQVNLATGEGGTGRQLGSAFKPFTLTAAFEQGIPSSKVYNGASGQTVDCGPGNAPYRVNNADGGGGYMDLWSATQGSVNAVFVQLSVDAGLEKVAETAHRMGIKSPVPPFCSMSLGTAEYNPLEVASAFATLANEGKHCEPFSIAKVIDRNGVETLNRLEKKPKCPQVVDKDIAVLAVNMLKRVVCCGTGTRAQLGTWPQFGKTGSTNDVTNAWFSGCTRQLCAATWVGHQEENLPMFNVHGIKVFGGTWPAQIWHDFMAVAMRGLPAVDWPGAPRPPGAVVPDVVGKTQEEAVKILDEAGFTPIAEEVPSLEPIGVVSEQNPGGGATVSAGSAVTIGVSNGKVPKNKVPNLVGLTEKEAKKRLKKAGFLVTVVYQPATNPALNGTVASQAPGTGTKAKEGSTVTISVWQYTAPPPSPPPSPPPTSPPPSPSPSPSPSP